MNSRSVLNLCIKVMGIYYALSALNMLPSSISQTILTWDSWKYAAKDDSLQMMMNFKVAALASMMIPLILFAISLLIVFNSEKICNFILKDEDSCYGEKWKNDILNIAIKMFGFFSLLSAIPPISSLLSKYWIMKDSIKLYDKTAKIELTSSGLRAFIYILVGVFLVLCSSAVAKRVSARDQVDRG